MKMTLEAKLDKVIIKPEEIQEMTHSGIILSKKDHHMPVKGVVVAVGYGTDDEPMELSVGDTVMYSRNAGTEWEHEGESFIFMRQCDVLTIIYDQKISD